MSQDFMEHVIERIKTGNPAERHLAATMLENYALQNKRNLPQYAREALNNYWKLLENPMSK